MTCAAIIVAAGAGNRAKRSSDIVAKQYIKIAGKSVLCHTLATFLDCPEIDLVKVVIARGDEALYEDAIRPLFSSDLEEKAKAKLLLPVTGGETRQASVRNGLEDLEAIRPQTVLIHDAARPFVTADILKRCRNALKNDKAFLVATPVTDTIKRVSSDRVIEETIDRTTLWAAQTPQGFDYAFILNAHRKAAAESAQTFTDDAAVAEWVGQQVRIVEGAPTNIKLTNRGDLDMAEQSLGGARTAPLSDIRMGTGYDVHAFEDGDAVIIGGVSIPHDRKLKGHSDADVGLHAITDAILGAIADGDIGTHFPPSDPQWKGAASDLFLKDAVRRVTERAGRISNIDLTIICEAPKIGPHRPAIRARIAEICDLSVGRISVKATTSEQLGFTGRREGIAALASVCVQLPDIED
ncbi:bifunctional 2-C-methyl-D-erythritol 4-phosphate cytidylyltransferase/2-C-methyl-D-erythritol 2,4-cyclodiphosphate synthase [uncultured Cohaesibacter sp.]|uniref:bifunctional 2-C-methyl-D-erythritol 4-phosphate cytidylyltransferase/2-C-methyl-D-erythritol 2,4-cyclodiphosphate synthase n=1 Tax=uncultured Cohaesibacter sp. TaxID=1002546 RepID=UPI0029C69150|nr:bifunctional 2-C-methyl-D-erythritol 4-phosphate cytidylyltransferase/2-C-methyl-D-erythritol 2,4-cyclodiphosphate synthase [uncultured Cohaesibacter sp.]